MHMAKLASPAVVSYWLQKHFSSRPLQPIFFPAVVTQPCVQVDMALSDAML